MSRAVSLKCLKSRLTALVFAVWSVSLSHGAGRQSHLSKKNGLNDNLKHQMDMRSLREKECVFQNETVPTEVYFWADPKSQAGGDVGSGRRAGRGREGEADTSS